MTKYKTTDREQRENNYIVVGFGYCDIQNITRYLGQASAYTCGVYGWRADFYEFGNRVLSTGYSPLTSYTDKAGKIACELIKKDLLAFDKKLDRKSYKIQNQGDFWKVNKFVKNKVRDIIEKNINKAFDIVEK